MELGPSATAWGLPAHPAGASGGFQRELTQHALRVGAFRVLVKERSVAVRDTLTDVRVEILRTEEREQQREGTSRWTEAGHKSSLFAVKSVHAVRSQVLIQIHRRPGPSRLRVGHLSHCFDLAMVMGYMHFHTVPPATFWWTSAATSINSPGCVVVW